MNYSPPHPAGCKTCDLRSAFLGYLATNLIATISIVAPPRNQLQISRRVQRSNAHSLLPTQVHVSWDAMKKSRSTHPCTDLPHPAGQSFFAGKIAFWIQERRNATDRRRKDSRSRAHSDNGHRPGGFTLGTLRPDRLTGHDATTSGSGLQEIALSWRCTRHAANVH